MVYLLFISHLCFSLVPVGLLTVDPSRRVTMDDLLQNEWIQGQQLSSSTPLMTPDILNSCASIQRRVKATMRAFHTAQREGFLLTDVSNAPLAKRRKQKKDSSTETRSSSSESTHSQGSSTTQESTPPTTFVNPLLQAPANATTFVGTTSATITTAALQAQSLPSISKHTAARLEQFESSDSLGFSPVLPIPVTEPKAPSAQGSQDSGYATPQATPVSDLETTPTPNTIITSDGTLTYSSILDPSMYPYPIQQPFIAYTTSVPGYFPVQYAAVPQSNVPPMTRTVPRTVPHPSTLPTSHHQHHSHLPTISEDPSAT